MKAWKQKRTPEELLLLKELDSVNSDIKLVKKNKKKNYQRNKQILSKKSNEIQEALKQLRYNRISKQNTPEISDISSKTFNKQQKIDFIIRFLKSQMQSYRDSNSEEHTLIYNAYKEISEKIYQQSYLKKEFDDEFYENTKEMIHLASSIIYHINSHTALDLNEEILFGLFYGVIDSLYEIQEDC